jgi:hypothetical protein
VLRVPRESAASALAVPMGHHALGQVAMGRLRLCLVLCAQAAGPHAEVSPLAFKFFFYFSEYIQMLASSKICIDLNSCQKILK